MEFLAMEYLFLVSALGATAGMLMVWRLFLEGIIVAGVILVREHVVPTMLKVLPVGIFYVLQRPIRRIQDFDELKDHCLTLKNNIKEDMAYPCLDSPKTTKETRSIRRIQKEPIHSIQDIECEDSRRYQTWSLLQDIPNTSYPTSFDTAYRPVSRLYKYKSLNSVLGMEVVRYKEFEELIQPFKDLERVS
ncbi:hypothetical protein Tco_0825929 [Tanacetum coccineum]